jgi:hypothetical protein
MPIGAAIAAARTQGTVADLRLARPQSSPTEPADQLVRAGDTADKLVARLLANAGPAIGGAFERHLTALAVDAVAKWPVRTGTSRAGLNLRLTKSGSDIVGVVSNDVPYARFIRFRGGQPYGTVALELLFKPAADLGARIAADAAPDLVEGV